MSKLNITRLKLSWTTSRGRDTYGYNICRLDDTTTGARYKTCGGGYDMVGTVFGKWLADIYQKELLKIQGNASHIISAKFGYISNPGDNRLYGMVHNQKEDHIILDGACGIDSMISIAKAIGLEVECDYNRRTRNNDGFYVSRVCNEEVARSFVD